MTQTINVRYDAENITLNIEETDVEVRENELVQWIFHGVPENFSPMIVFKSTVEKDTEKNPLRYYGPFAAITQEIPGEDGGQTRVWGVVTNPLKLDHKYRAMIQTGVGEDPFDEPYGNSPDSVGKAVMVSTEGVLRKKVMGAVKEDVDRSMKELLNFADDTSPLAVLSGRAKVVPITEYTNDDGDKELRIHDHDLFIKRKEHDTVIWDFTPVPQHQGWFPIIDFIGGEGMAYEDIKNMHFGPFNSITITVARVIGRGHGKVRGQYHYRAAMANISTHRMAFKSSPDPVVDYPDPNVSGSEDF